MNGKLTHVYRTRLILRQELKPHKIKDHKFYKTPMPPPKEVLKMEKLREKGFEVEYPRAPWYTDNIEKIKKEAEELEKKRASEKNAEFLEKIPASREEGNSAKKPKIQKQQIVRKYKFV